MARSLRIAISGALYHVKARGNAREPIFADDQDWESFLDGLTDACRRFNWAL